MTTQRHTNPRLRQFLTDTSRLATQKRRVIVVYDHHLQSELAFRCLDLHFGNFGGLTPVSVSNFIPAANGDGLFEFVGVPVVDVAWGEPRTDRQQNRMAYLEGRLLDWYVCGNEQVGGAITVYSGSTFAERLHTEDFAGTTYDLTGIKSRDELAMWCGQLLGEPIGLNRRMIEELEGLRVSVSGDDAAQTAVLDALEHVRTVAPTRIETKGDAYSGRSLGSAAHRQALTLLAYLKQPIRFRSSIMTGVLAQTEDVDAVLHALQRATRRALRLRLRMSLKTGGGIQATAQSNDRLLLWIATLAEASDQVASGAKLWVAADRRAAMLDRLCHRFESMVAASEQSDACDWIEKLKITSPARKFWADDRSLIYDWLRKGRFMLPADRRVAVATTLLDNEIETMPVLSVDDRFLQAVLTRNPAAARIVARICHKVAPSKPILLVGARSDCLAVARASSKRFICQSVVTPHDEPCGHCEGCVAPDFGRAEAALDWSKGYAIDWLAEQVGYQGLLGVRAITLLDVDQVSASEVESFLKRFEQLLDSVLIVLTARKRGYLPSAIASRCLPILLK